MNYLMTKKWESEGQKKNEISEKLFREENILSTSGHRRRALRSQSQNMWVVMWTRTQWVKDHMRPIDLLALRLR